ncbi:MAG: tRNA/rRNA methyltransferase [Candidatus Moranbacteria bacterium GW2011_GWF1_34_10]|nr:MAG: tRNA/rRNA methyltransferase [Candidatus Moranbacteria bacterium GW2011_GWF1_34_10]
MEQNENSVDYRAFKPSNKVVLIVGNEPRGIDKRILKKCDIIMELPMRGKKQSLNVAVALGVAGYKLTEE